MYPVVADFQWSKISPGILDTTVSRAQTFSTLNIFELSALISHQDWWLWPNSTLLFGENKRITSFWAQRLESAELGASKVGVSTLGAVPSDWEVSSLLVMRAVKCLKGHCYFIRRKWRRTTEIPPPSVLFLWKEGQRSRLTRPQGRKGSAITSTFHLRKKERYSYLRFLHMLPPII